MNGMLMLLAAAFGLVLGIVFGIGLLVPAVGKVVYGSLHPGRIVDPHHRWLATWMWAMMSCALVLISIGSLMWMWTLIGLGLMCACVAVVLGVRFRLMLAHEAQVRRVAQEAAFWDELEQVLRSER